MKRRTLILVNVASLFIATVAVCVDHLPNGQTSFGKQQRWIIFKQGNEIDVTSYASFRVWRILPDEFLGIALAVPIFTMAGTYYRWKHERIQSRVGCCCVCGYDLRASPERCPECGTPAVIEE